VIISIEALLLATYLVGSRTVMQMQSNAIGYAKPVTDAVIRVYDRIGNAIETQEHKDDFKES
jgi:hypothetical protein